MTTVIKFGGNAMVDDQALTNFINKVLELQKLGQTPVVVHGGGPQISKALDRAGIVSEFKGGFRVTTKEAVKVVRDVLVNEVNKQLVELLNQMSLTAVSLPGDLNGLLTAQHQEVLVDGKLTDLGYVGEVIGVDTDAINEFLTQELIPVISTAACDKSGQLFNVNADTATSAIAIALKADEMIMLTDVPGVYRNWPDQDSLIEQLTANELETLLPTMQSGMVPKLQACLQASRGGVPTVRVTGDLSKTGTQVVAN